MRDPFPPVSVSFGSRASLALLAILALGPGCASGPAESAVDDGSQRGELAVYISDDAAGRSETTYFLRDALGREQKLVFDTAPSLAPGAGLKVWGVATPAGLRVTSYEPLPGSEATVQSALIGATPFAPRSFAFVLIDIGGGVNTTADAVAGIMGTNVDSIRNYYLGDSYQMQDISTTVFGPIAYTMPACATTDTTTLATTLRPMVTTAAGGATFQHYLWYLGSKNAACAWSGLASVGTAQTPSHDTWYNASTNCVVLVQEPGHNFGMQHSSSLACPSASFADDPNSCTASEYGDTFDPMGGGCRHMNAWQKSYQGWLGGCNGVKVTNTGTFNLVPFELSCNGVQFLQIQAPKARSFMRPAAGGGAATTENLAFYYVELRTPNDFDGTLGNRTALTPMVLVHVADDLHSRTERGVHTFLLDMTPATAGTRAFSDAGLPVGQTFTDPAGGVSITTEALSATGATITVSYTAGSGNPVCLDGTAFAAPGPGIESCSAAGGAAGSTGTGSAGTTGTPGTGGGAGTVTGAAGIGGLGGPTLTGVGGTNGLGGSASTGAAGSGETPVPGPAAASGGCACEAGTGGSNANPALLLGLALAVSLRPRARRKR